MTNAGIAWMKEERSTSVETYNTQEGCCTGLHKLIIANIPADLLVELKDPNSRLDKVKPHDLLVIIQANETPVKVANARALKASLDKPLTVDGNVTLTVQLALKRKAVAELTRIHQVTSSKRKMMME